MDLKAYYRRINEVERRIEEEYPVLRSLPTASGAGGGRLTETTRAIAARMIANGQAELVSPDEAQAFRTAAAEAARREAERRRASQIQFNVVTEETLRELTRPAKGRKGD